MAELPMPDIPDGNLRDLIAELHSLHARAGWPSVRDMAKGQPFSYHVVHELFTTCRTERPSLPVLLSVVATLAARDPRSDPDRVLDKFDRLWQAAKNVEQEIDQKRPADLLTFRERQILELLMLGASTQQIATQLMMGIRTTETCVGRIYRKFEVHSRDELLAKAEELKLRE
ncbi:helix-turn-helix transcriptional regulator [Nucisporomicrobium flavum]|uniref:helix-turn-helix transcriptional regulator n=1 Tax=Nucisporomicrobium flavum TaxID=2785915 RepID=UPI0018F753C2|nr:helix-turn-helix transcriptional regulator [Nucisporomicrobium flavum]